METLSIVLVALGVVIGLAAIAFWVAMLVSCIRTKQLLRRERIAWLVAIVFGKLFGAGLYYFCRYRHEDRPSTR